MSAACYMLQKSQNVCVTVQVRPTASQRRKLKQLHWDKIKAPQEGTIWHQASGLNPNLNFAELESLFQVGQSCSGAC
jgi:hypothetical protein